MSNFLRQATASQSRAIGPFVDDTDFKTAETALTIANTDVLLIVNGGASAAKNSGGGTHRANGFYGVTFDATDTATVGEIEVSVKVAGALQVFKTFVVLEEAVYDLMFAAGAVGTSVDLLDLANGVETGLTVRQALRLALAALAGKCSGAELSAPVFRNAIADSKNRISATGDAYGNRSAITTDLT